NHSAMLLKFYADRTLLPEGFAKTSLLYPFWGAELSKSEALLEARRYERYSAIASTLFEFTAPKDAHAALLPFNWEQVLDYPKNHPNIAPDIASQIIAQVTRQAEELSAQSAAQGKPLLVFFVHDDSRITVPLQNSMVFRPSLEHSLKQPNE